MLAPFDVVGVQQRVAGLAGDDGGELPPEVGGVADATVVALALPHRHQMCGIACQHQAPLAERARDARMMGVYAMPDHVDPIGMRNPLCEHASDEGGIVGEFVGLVVVNQELEAPDTVGDGDRHVRPLGVGSDLTVRVAQRIVGDVDHEPAGRRRRPIERHAHQSAGGAASAVAADDVAGTHRILAVGELER